MKDSTCPAQRLLGQLVSAIAADGGATLYLADGEGGMEVAATVPGTATAGARFHRLRAHASDSAPRRLLVDVPDARRGVVLLERRRPEDFSADDRAVARLYARQLAEHVAVERVQTKASRWTRQLEGIQAAVAQMIRLSTVQEVGQAICVETHRVIEYDTARVYVMDADRGVLEPIASLTTIASLPADAGDAQPVRIGDGIVGRVAAHGTARILERGVSEPTGGCEDGGVSVADQSMIVVPLRHERRVLGVIVVSRHSRSRFDENDLRLMQIISDQAAVAIENARLLAGRDKMVGELKALLEISQATQLADDEATLAAVFAEKLLRASGVDACVIVRLDETSSLLRTVGARGLKGAIPTCDALDHRLIRRVLRDAAPQVIQADAADADPADAGLMEQLGARTLLMLPLVVGGRSIGLVELAATSERREFLTAELDALRTMANQVGTVLENARLVEQLRHAADVDQVTGANNHRYLQERLKQECARSARSHSPMSVLMIDLDGFKSVNDRYGHADGDRVLRTVAAGLKLAVRTNDVVARYGGDEFVVLMPDTDECQGKAVARRILDEIRGHRHEMSDGGCATIDASAGLSVYPEDGQSPRALLEASDAAMYAVKRAGGGDVGRGSPRVRTHSRPRAGEPGRADAPVPSEAGASR